MRNDTELQQLEALRKFEVVQGVEKRLLWLYNSTKIIYARPLPKHSLVWKLSMGLTRDILDFLTIYLEDHPGELDKKTLFENLMRGSVNNHLYDETYDCLHAIITHTYTYACVSVKGVNAWEMEQAKSLVSNAEYGKLASISSPPQSAGKS